MTHVNKNLSKKQRNIWYEARLLSGNGDSGEKAKKVYVYISPKVWPESDFECTIKLTKSNLLERNIYNAFNYLSVFFNWHRIF